MKKSFSQFIIVSYINEFNVSPIHQWLKTIDDTTATKVATYICRLANGNLSNSKRLSEYLYEIKINYGPGIRVYYGIKNSNLIVLLWGGIKKNQVQDINRASRYWAMYTKIGEHILWD